MDWDAFSPSLEDRPAPWVPLYQIYPLLIDNVLYMNLNALDAQRMNNTFWTSYSTHEPSIEVITLTDPTTTSRYTLESQISQPIFETLDDNGEDEEEDDRKVVGSVWLAVDWITYFQNLLPESAKGLTVVMKNTCGTSTRGAVTFTYEINGLQAVEIGEGDHHDKNYDELEVTFPLLHRNYDETRFQRDVECLPQITFSMYPSKAFEETFYTDEATHYTVGVVAIFAFTTLVFMIYDFSVRRRQAKVMDRIIRQDKIVSNVFPSAIRDRLYANKNDNDGDAAGFMEGGLDGDLENPDIFGAAPLADLFPKVTIVMADISGFTAWSSAREPPQVFSLLECIYGAFDKIAYRHGVFKVETVGDLYIGVAGLPEERDDHAMVVAKFARDCVHKMSELTRKLEVTLG